MRLALGCGGAQRALRGREAAGSTPSEECAGSPASTPTNVSGPKSLMRSGMFQRGLIYLAPPNPLYLSLSVSTLVCGGEGVGRRADRQPTLLPERSRSAASPVYFLPHFPGGGAGSSPETERRGGGLRSPSPGLLAQEPLLALPSIRPLTQSSPPALLGALYELPRCLDTEVATQEVALPPAQVAGRNPNGTFQSSLGLTPPPGVPCTLSLGQEGLPRAADSAGHPPL